MYTYPHLTPPTIGEDEELLLVDICSSPIFKKYLTLLAIEATTELIGLAAENLAPDQLAIRHATTRGRLAVLTTLLSITKETVS